MSKLSSLMHAFMLITVTIDTAWAGTTIIDVRTEGSGTIVKQTAQGEVRNLNGAAVWNGSEWVVNSTYAHKYFIDVRDGRRLKDFQTYIIDSTPAALGDLGFFGYCNVKKRAYEYSKKGKGPDLIYTYQVIEYLITDPAGKIVLLRSKGTGNGTEKAYFDVFIDDEVLQTTAFKGDPLWLTYPGLRPEEAAAQEPDAGVITGQILGAEGAENADVYFDLGGGSDLGPQGIGKSFELHIGAVPLADVKTENTNSPLITSFEYKYMDASGNLHRLVFQPVIISQAKNCGAEGTILVKQRLVASNADLVALTLDVSRQLGKLAKKKPADLRFVKSSQQAAKKASTKANSLVEAFPVVLELCPGQTSSGAEVDNSSAKAQMVSSTVSLGKTAKRMVARLVFYRLQAGKLNAKKKKAINEFKRVKNLEIDSATQAILDLVNTVPDKSQA